MKHNKHPDILSPNDSSFLRQSYFEAFINTDSDHYKQYVNTTHQFTDGFHYEGYLWDCLIKRDRISFQRLCLEVVQHKEVLVMADDHSRDLVINAPLWPYPPYSVVLFESQTFIDALAILPEDLYIFDDSVSWTLIPTHEFSYKPKTTKRICYAVGSGK